MSSKETRRELRDVPPSQPHETVVAEQPQPPTVSSTSDFQPAADAADSKTATREQGGKNAEIEHEQQPPINPDLKVRSLKLIYRRPMAILCAALAVVTVCSLSYVLLQRQALNQRSQDIATLQQQLSNMQGRLPPDEIQNALATMRNVGIVNMWSGGYSDAENQRLSHLIRNAATIRIIFYAGNRMFDSSVPGFGQDFVEFLHRDGTSIQVLLADPGNDFYTQNTILDVPPKGQKNVDKANFKGQQDNSNFWLKNVARDPSQVNVRFFTNQMRLPLIIFDDNHCIMTIRLTGPAGTIRVEFGPAESSYIKTCIEHFNRVWNADTTIPAPTQAH
jgi:hypothetical protein